MVCISLRTSLSVPRHPLHEFFFGHYESATNFQNRKIRLMCQFVPAGQRDAQHLCYCCCVQEQRQFIVVLVACCTCPSFLLSQFFLCLSVLALLTLLPQPAASETELFYNYICKNLLLGNVDASIPIPQPPKPKNDVLLLKNFFVSQATLVYSDAVFVHFHCADEPFVSERTDVLVYCVDAHPRRRTNCFVTGPALMGAPVCAAEQVGVHCEFTGG